MALANGQSRRSSLVEQIANITSGFVLSVIVWQWVVCPLFGMRVPLVRGQA